jgi:hypothetical protein
MPFKNLATQKHDCPTPEQIEAKNIHIFVETDWKLQDRGGASVFVLQFYFNHSKGSI